MEVMFHVKFLMYSFGVDVKPNTFGHMVVFDVGTSITKHRIH